MSTRRVRTTRGQFDKCVVENAEYVSKSGHTELSEVIVGSLIENYLKQLLDLNFICQIYLKCVIAQTDLC